MQYISTRGQVPAVSFSTAVAQGLAPDGGLYLPEELPNLRPHLGEWSKLSYAELCEAFFAIFATDIDSAELKEVVASSYTKFDHADIAPIVKLDDDRYVLELFHGPRSHLKISHSNCWVISTNHRSRVLEAAFPFLVPHREIPEPPLFMACSAKKVSLPLSSIPMAGSRRCKSAR